MVSSKMNHFQSKKLTPMTSFDDNLLYIYNYYRQPSFSNYCLDVINRWSFTWNCFFLFSLSLFVDLEVMEHDLRFLTNLQCRFVSIMNRKKSEMKEKQRKTDPLPFVTKIHFLSFFFLFCTFDFWSLKLSFFPHCLQRHWKVKAPRDPKSNLFAVIEVTYTDANLLRLRQWEVFL